MIELTVTSNGLEVSADNEGVEYINDHKDRSYFIVWADLMESHACNGGACFITADQLGALSEAPCILEGLEYDEDGEFIPVGRIWCFNDYMVRNELQELAEGKTVLFTELR